MFMIDPSCNKHTFNNNITVHCNKLRLRFTKTQRFSSGTQISLRQIFSGSCRTCWNRIVDDSLIEGILDPGNDLKKEGRDYLVGGTVMVSRLCHEGGWSSLIGLWAGGFFESYYDLLSEENLCQIMPEPKVQMFNPYIRIASANWSKGCCIQWQNWHANLLYPAIAWFLIPIFSFFGISIFPECLEPAACHTRRSKIYAVFKTVFHGP